MGSTALSEPEHPIMIEDVVNSRSSFRSQFDPPTKQMVREKRFASCPTAPKQSSFTNLEKYWIMLPAQSLNSPVSRSRRESLDCRLFAVCTPVHSSLLLSAKTKEREREREERRIRLNQDRFQIARGTKRSVCVCVHRVFARVCVCVCVASESNPSRP